MIKGSFDKIKDIDCISDDSKIALLNVLMLRAYLTLENGVYPLKSGDRMIISEFEAENDDGVFEAHREYIDIHVGLTENEYVAFCDIRQAVPTTNYVKEDDYQLFSIENRNDITLDKDTFVLFDANDVHKCGLSKIKNAKIKKIIFKIKKL